MHNLHLIRVKAESANEACKIVRRELEDFGNENNYYTICGCVSENDVVFDLNEGRFSPKGFTIEKINHMVNTWLLPDETDKSAYEKADSEKNVIDWMFAKHYCNHMQQLCMLKEKGQLSPVNDFDVLKEKFYEYEYTQCGVTELDSFSEENDETYIVFVDMHS